MDPVALRAKPWKRLGLALVLAACSTTTSEGSLFDQSLKGGGGGGPGTTGSGSNGSPGGSLAEEGDFATNIGDPNATLQVDPPDVTLVMAGSPDNPTGKVQLRVYDKGDANKASLQANWSVENSDLGTVSSTGEFQGHALAGTTKVTARVGNKTATATVQIKLNLQESLVTLTDSEKAALASNASNDSAFRWLYPYDKTVFPRGLSAPTLQFGNTGTAPKAYRLTIQTPLAQYEGTFPNMTNDRQAARLRIPDAWWESITRSAGGKDAVVVRVTKLAANGQATGPIEETWRIAQGSLKGSIFYNSYNSPKAGDTGAILRIRPGKDAEIALNQVNVASGGTSKATKCVVCHSVSASGKTLVSGLDWGAGNPMYGISASLNESGVPTVTKVDDEGRKVPFGAVSPDGRWVLGSGVPAGGAGIRGLSAAAPGFPSKVYDTTTGALVSDGYFSGASRFALMPSLSPDGKWLVFTDNDNSGRLSLLKVANATATPAFAAAFADGSGLVDPGTQKLGWPSFTPDSKAVLYHRGDSYDTAGHVDNNTALMGARHADLEWVDVTTKKTAVLEALNGCGTTGCALPYSEAEDGHLNWEPTLLPAAVGGYHWVVFTSRRSYGNTVWNGATSVNTSGDHAFDNSTYVNATGPRGLRKKLWVAAIDIDGTPGQDISHPAFYLEGQELQAGNMRGFWALDPCKSDGNTCGSGDECCGGYCRQVSTADGGTAKQCLAQGGGCSNDGERCSSDADCCNYAGGIRCLSNVCGLPTPR